MGGLSTLTLEFWAVTGETTTDLAASLTLGDLSFAFTVLINNMTVNMSLGTINVNKITVNSCSFGHLSAILMKTELNNFFRIFTPIINKDLQQHPLTVPSDIFGIFLLSDLTIGYYNNYIYLGATPTFIAPTQTPVMEKLLAFTK